MSEKPLAIDLCGGLGGWAEGFLAEGYQVRGYDIEAHDYGSGGYPGELILRDVRSIHGSEFQDAAVIVASPPCTEYSYMAMPWRRSKQIAKALRGHGEFPEGYTGSRTVAELNALFDACFRIQREACEAAGRVIPMVVENVRGAQPWVGRAKANFGSYYLWGDVGMVGKRVVAGAPKFGVSVQPMGKEIKGPGGDWFKPGRAGLDACRDAIAMREAQKRNPDGTDHGSGSWFKIADSKNRGAKTEAHLNIRDGHSHTRHLTNQVEHTKVPGISLNGEKGATSPGLNVTAAQRYREGVKDKDSDGYERTHPNALGWKSPRTSSGATNSRKAASAQIAKIPFPLAQHIARCFAGQKVAA